MEKTFYIPTSTLNYNNIMSIESLSPKSFYEQRGYGYPRWTEIPENPYKNAIVLYDKPFMFERPSSEEEDHPMLIEIKLDENIINKSDNFFYCDHTIYLAPTTTEFWFFSEHDKSITQSMSAYSLETKMTNIYNKKIIVKDGLEKSKKILPKDEPCPLNEDKIKEDISINKMKGLLYGYYIGASLSTDEPSVKRINNLKEIRDIFVAILSSTDKIPTNHQNERLNKLFLDVEPELTKLTHLLESIKGKDTVDSSLYKNIESFLQKTLGKYSKDEMLSYLGKADEENEQQNKAIVWINSLIENEKKQIKHNRKNLSPEGNEIVVKDANLYKLENSVIKNEMERKICFAWINETFLDKDNDGKISAYREQLADDVTTKAKDVCSESWEDSSIRTYLNALRHHIGGEDFKQEWSNSLLSSTAAVVLAGESWEKLLTYMQRKEMTDYRLAFAFYGELNGFANLTRDFTDQILELEGDKEYIWALYKDFYSQLHGVKLTENESDSKKRYSEKNITKGYNEEKRISSENSEHENETVTSHQKVQKKKTQKKKRKSNDSNDGNLFAQNTVYEFIKSLDSLSKFSEDAIKRCVENFTYTETKHPNDEKEHINFFVNLCAKEGKGEVNNYPQLKGIFTEEIKDKVKKEMLEKYPNYKNSKY